MSIKQAIAELEEVERWMESQAKAQSKGGHATFDLMLLREQRDRTTAALAALRAMPQGDSTTDVPEADCGNMQASERESFESSPLGGNPPTPMRNFAAAINNLVAAVSDAVLGTPLRAMPAEPVAWYDVEDGQIISAPRWYSDGGRTEAPLYATPHPAPVLTEAWQPIETAPKDGRTLLLGYFNSHGKWRTMRGRWYSLDTIVEEWEESDLAGEGWYETVVESDDYPNCWWAEPTHWMHLPPPPAAALAGDTGEAAK